MAADEHDRWPAVETAGIDDRVRVIDPNGQFTLSEGAARVLLRIMRKAAARTAEEAGDAGRERLAS